MNQSNQKYLPGSWIALTSFTPPAPPSWPKKKQEDEEVSYLEQEGRRYDPYSGMQAAVSNMSNLQIPYALYPRLHALDGHPYIVRSQSGQFLGLMDPTNAINFSINLSMYSVELLGYEYVRWFLSLVNVGDEMFATEPLKNYYFADGKSATAEVVRFETRMRETSFANAYEIWKRNKENEQANQKKEESNFPPSNQNNCD